MIPAVSAATGGGGAGTLPYLWITAGQNGELYTSTSTTVANGSWTSRTSSFGTTTIRQVASNGMNLYVAVGDDGKLATSPDGITWTQQTSSFGTSSINSIAYGNGYWVAVGQAAKVAYSTDGVTWTQKTTGISGTLNRVAWGNGLWIIGAQASGAQYRATDPTGTWTASGTTITQMVDLHYYAAQSIWVSGNDTGTTGSLQSSSDGATFTARNTALNFSSQANSVAFASNSSVLALMGTTGILTVDINTSTNGASWTDRTPASTSGIPYFGMSDDAGLLVFAGFQTSSDGTTWSSRTQPSSNIICGCHSSGTPSIR